ncbi:helix-turn-helix transcriptional regulator [Sphingomonas sp. dw_22]|uniref:helix-turn-helix domain-containing protein n=1 Tax=Sphingomonas sp. dw_22 TaxID=2721175 RepID=UPI001BD599AA|nr:helix-turn-helix transcriptional regulator [Sphingomonas sp. dw_22]
MSLNGDGQEGIDAEAFGARIRQAAAQRNYSPAELARRSNIAKQTMSAYWNGQRFCGAERLFALAEALGVDARWLVEGEPEGEVDGGEAREAALLEAYRELDARRKAALVEVARAMAGRIGRPPGE